MFKRNAVRNMNEDYCPVLNINERKAENQKAAQPVADQEHEATRGELFVMAANIYFRARKNTRARAAGII